MKQPICVPMKEKTLNPTGLRAITLPLSHQGEALTQAFGSAPQFGQIDLPATLVRGSGAGALRVILVGNTGYDREHCAMYLATLAQQKKGGVAPPAQDLTGKKVWTPLGLVDISELDEEDEEDEDNGPTHDLSQSLVVVDAHLVGSPSPLGKENHGVSTKVSLRFLECPALYVGASALSPINQEVVDEVLHRAQENDGKPLHLFFSIQPGQMERNLADHLQLNHGFVVCQVGAPTQDYLEAMFWQQAQDYYPGLAQTGQVDAGAVVEHLRHLRGKDFSQRDVVSAVARTFPLGKSAPELTTGDFAFAPTPLTREKSARGKLNAMTQLDQVKEATTRLLALDKLNQRRRQAGQEVAPRHRHMAFTGAPGTGKTVCAQLLAQILAEEGEGSGLFVEAGREDMIGSYMGHTAPKIAKLFENARGGVLFLDEIGALVPDAQGDSYTQEAINALVYHMDRSPETLVIFATYPQEMEDFLTSNPGLKSRLAQTLHFPSYDQKALGQILENLAVERGYTLEKKATKLCLTYLQELEATAPRTFGNGREVRRIFNACEEELAVRLEMEGLEEVAGQIAGKVANNVPEEVTGEDSGKDSGQHSGEDSGKDSGQIQRKVPFTMTQKDMKAAIARLKPKEEKKMRQIGFAV